MKCLLQVLRVNIKTYRNYTLKDALVPISFFKNVWKYSSVENKTTDINLVQMQARYVEQIHNVMIK